MQRPTDGVNALSIIEGLGNTCFQNSESYAVFSCNNSCIIMCLCDVVFRVCQRPHRNDCDDSYLLLEVSFIRTFFFFASGNTYLKVSCCLMNIYTHVNTHT